MLRIHLFGGLTLFLEQTPHPFSALPKTSPLLAYLLLHPQPINRNRLAFTLWPDVDETTARGNLRRHLYELNRALPPPHPDTPWLRREGGDVQWNPQAPYWLDTAVFTEQIRAGRLAEAVQLYKGRLLPLVDEAWLRPEQDRLHNLFLLTLQRLIDEQRQERRYAEALLSAQRLLRYDPLHEAGQRQVMLFRYALGDRAGAIQTYQQFADLLERELGVPPMPETTALRDQILANTPPALLLAEGSQPPTAVSTRHSPSPLPHPPRLASLRPLIGRQQEQAQLAQLLTEKGRRLVTLTGPSGIGKSSLAVAVADHLARHQANRFPDGLFFIPLASLFETEQWITAVSAAIRLPSPATTLDALIEALRYKQALLLLDNFEHLLPAADSLARLLQAAPGLTALVTSQSLLHLYGEQAFPLSGLRLPPLLPLPPPDELAAYEAIALFTEAAQAANPRFCLTEKNGTAVAHICHRLDGLPLALELAAARSGLLSPAEILAQLEDMLAFLATPARDVPTRHRSMEAALAWSYSLLDEREQGLFARLAVFTGGFDLAGAAAVNGTKEGETAVLLDALRAKNLIHIAAEPDGRQPLDMLFTIRAFAQAKLAEQGQEAAARARHAAYFAGLCRFSSSDPAFNMGEHIARLAAVQANLLTAVAHLTAQSSLTAEQQEQLAWLLRVLPQVYFRYGRVKEGARWLARVEGSLDRLPEADQPPILAQFAALAREHGEYERAATYLERALTLARQLQDNYLMSRALLHLGALAGIQEEYAQAVALTEEAIVLDEGLRSGPMTAEKAHWWQNRALDLKYLGRYEEALALLAEARGFLERQGDQMSLAGNRHTVAGVFLAQEQYQAAGQWYEMGRETAVAANYPRLIWLSLRGVAHVAAAQGEWARSVRLYSQANQLALTLGFSLIPVMRRQEESHLAQARQTLSPAAFREAWSRGEQSAGEDLL